MIRHGSACNYRIGNNGNKVNASKKLDKFRHRNHRQVHFIEGIKKGVFEAVVEAFDMSGSMNNDKDKDVIVNLTIKADSETLYKVVRKGQKKYDNRYHVVATI